MVLGVLGGKIVKYTCSIILEVFWGDKQKKEILKRYCFRLFQTR